jgi:hypothetical protein
MIMDEFLQSLTHCYRQAHESTITFMGRFAENLCSLPVTVWDSLPLNTKNYINNIVIFVRRHNK